MLTPQSTYSFHTQVTARFFLSMRDIASREGYYYLGARLKAQDAAARGIGSTTIVRSSTTAGRYLARRCGPSGSRAASAPGYESSAV